MGISQVTEPWPFYAYIIIWDMMIVICFKIIFYNEESCHCLLVFCSVIYL